MIDDWLRHSHHLFLWSRKGEGKRGENRRTRVSRCGGLVGVVETPLCRRQVFYSVYNYPLNNNNLSSIDLVVYLTNSTSL